MKKIKYVLIIVVLLFHGVITFADTTDYETVVIRDPYMGELIDGKEVFLNWDRCTTADYYLVTVYDESTKEVLIDEKDTNESSMMLTDLKAGHRYEAIVKAVYGSDYTSSKVNFIVAGDVEVPRIMTPDANEKVELKDLKVNWEHISDDYKLIIVDKTDEKIIVDEDISYATYIVSSDLLTAGHEYKITVEVNSLNSLDDSYFRVKDDQLSKPEIIDPTPNKVISGDTIKIDWLNVDSFDTYVIKLNNDTEDKVIFDNVLVDHSYYSIESSDLDAGCEYTIFVGAKKNDEIVWSERLFYLEGSEAERPKIDFPKDDVTLAYGDIAIDWEKCDNSTYYRISLLDLTTDEQLIKLKWLTKSEYEVDQDLLIEGHEYQVEVMSIGYRQETGKTDKVTFKVEEQMKVTLPDEVVYGGQLRIVFEKPQVYDLKVFLQDELVYSQESISDEAVDVFKSLGIHEVMITYDDKSITKKIKVVPLVSVWAQPFHSSILENRILDDQLYNKILLKPKANLTRLEFSQILVSLYDSLDLEEVSIKKTAFVDLGTLTDKEVLAVEKAYSLGITSGVSDISFEPEGNITREMMATMLSNLLEVVYDEFIDETVVFEDNNEISEWARIPVIKVSALNILEGYESMFSPKAPATHEMGIVILDKMYSLLSE